MPLASRVALLKRVGAIIGSDRPIPTTWGEFNVTERLMIEDRDPQAAAVLKGQLSGELELEILSGKWADRYEGQSVEQQQAQARAEYLAQAEQRMADELAAMQARNAQRRLGDEAARQESAEIANMQLAMEARANGAWGF
ncbi:MAG: hypothetical protein RLZZ631_1286 [Cyanobacteriota bacterium]|jgi:hypothetical protein